MPITHRDLFHKIASLRKQFQIPVKISHLYHSDSLSKADEAFWEYKCENNIDHPLRYSEMHRILSVSKKRKRAALINLDVTIFEEYDLVPVFLHRDLVFRKCSERGVSIIHNFCWNESKKYGRTVSEIAKLVKSNKISNIVGTLIRDWVVEVPLYKAMIVAQVSKDFEDLFHCDVQTLLTKCYVVLKGISTEHAKQFKKDVKVNYYGSKKKVFCDEKTRSQKIT